MRRTLLRLAIPLGVAGAIVATGAPAFGGAPIGPGQSFLGEVNAKHTAAVVQVVCPGPAGPGRTGPPRGGQTVAVAPSPALAGPGFTGSKANHIVVRFADDPSLKMQLTAYSTPTAIPTGLRLPCDGTGHVRFTPKPTSPSARADVVTVMFQNIAD
jgi:hypothetical protein